MPVDPAQLRIQTFPAAVLKQPTGEIDLNDETRAVARRMIELMHGAEGIGLAAPQIGLSWRLFVAHVPASEPAELESDNPTATAAPEAYFNPVIQRREGSPEIASEGCLSLPGITGDVMRQPIVEMHWTDLKGNARTARAGGLLARCWQHEMDHLEGVLILDRMTEPSRVKMKPQIRALEKQASNR